MAVTIELNEKLAQMAGGVESLQVEAATIQDAVIALARLHRPVAARIFNCEGALRSVVKVEVNGEGVPADQASNKPLKEGDILRLSFP